ncbi:mandelate racemase/muconate lactonizing enzyme family protein [Coralliovum pocilloporae]|uniref:mandelate racemase/muconate lactonizing enzyme family protein n=1 Tax=Coralliovum pocilloporae TaxID=3066369 RepID=UPI003307B5A1
MKIKRITVWQKTLPLSKPYWLSGGRLKFEALDSTILRIETDTGLSGWGEGCPWGHTYLPAFGGGIRAGLELLAPQLLGQQATAIDRLNQMMDVVLPGHPYIKSPIDIALWDLLGKHAELPVYTLLGGADGDHIDVNSSISTGTPDEMVSLIEEARAKGYRTHSAKLGGGHPQTDIDRIEAIEAALQPDEFVTYDINRAWTPAVAIEVMNSASARGWFEQPCETFDQCRHVRQHTTQPIMLDECMHSLQDHLDGWRYGACEGVKVKPNRLGGLTKSRQVRDFCTSVGWRMHIEDVGGTVLADTAAMHLALSTKAENRLASWLAHAHLIDDPAPDQGARNRDGKVVLPDKPGLDVEPDLDWLGEPVAVYGAV